MRGPALARARDSPAALLARVRPAWRVVQAQVVAVPRRVAAQAVALRRRVVAQADRAWRAVAAAARRVWSAVVRPARRNGGPARRPAARAPSAPREAPRRAASTATAAALAAPNVRPAGPSDGDEGVAGEPVDSARSVVAGAAGRASALLGSSPSVAGWSGAPESTPAITTAAQTPRTTTQSTKGITPPRMVTPTEPDAHGPAADPGDDGTPGDPSPAPPGAGSGDAAAPAPDAAGDGAPTPALDPSEQGADAPPPPVPANGDGAPDAASPGVAPGGNGPEGAAAPPAPPAPGDGDGSPADLVAPPPPPPPVATRRRRRGRIALGIGTFLLVAFLLGAAFFQLPYFLFKPGSVRDTEPLISVSGAEVYPSDGSIGYTTVSLRQATLIDLVRGWLDDDIDVYPRDEVLGGRNVDENRQINLQMMANSKEVATFVALDRLGYDVSMSVGQMVSDVVPESPADGVIEPGDIITAIDGESFDEPDDLSRLLADEAPGDEVVVTVQTSPDEDEDVDIALVASPDDPSRAIIGVQVEPIAMDFDFPFDVEIDTGDVGGPSAGLAFTLALIDDLTPGDLTGGADVAVTGTMSPDGSVGPIGGAGQKAAAVRRDGLDLFLVPSADYEDAVARAGPNLEVVAVDNIDEALDALGDHGGNVDDLPVVGESAAAATG